MPSPPGERHTTASHRQPTRLAPRTPPSSDRTLPPSTPQSAHSPPPPPLSAAHHLCGVERLELVGLGARTQSPHGQHVKRLLQRTNPRSATPDSSTGMAWVEAATAAAPPPSSQSRSGLKTKKQKTTTASPVTCWRESTRAMNGHARQRLDRAGHVERRWHPTVNVDAPAWIPRAR